LINIHIDALHIEGQNIGKRNMHRIIASLSAHHLNRQIDSSLGSRLLPVAKLLNALCYFYVHLPACKTNAASPQRFCCTLPNSILVAFCWHLPSGKVKSWAALHAHAKCA